MAEDIPECDVTNAAYNRTICYPACFESTDVFNSTLCCEQTFETFCLASVQYTKMIMPVVLIVILVVLIFLMVFLHIREQSQRIKHIMLKNEEEGLDSNDGPKAQINLKETTNGV